MIEDEIESELTDFERITGEKLPPLPPDIEPIDIPDGYEDVVFE